MKTTRIASGALAVALAFGAAACDAEGTTTDDGVGGVEDPLDPGTTAPGTTAPGTTDTGTTSDTGTTGTDG